MKAIRKQFMIRMAEQNINATQLAKSVPINRSYLSQVLLGNSKPSELMAVKIAKALNSHVEDLFEKNEVK